ncbi:hypothetical protein [Kitasatospora purpeofusca]|uniref:hypothetical protein n=1 Tax=Kitasatospora purpeofusca TaxID=67352 RepID=UPI002A5A1EA3|nr:hypothetical protein [Kitasatospora purpeofusca]MDY0812783.1 hypothetical protein [Kitasatospora purpeofusca]
MLLLWLSVLGGYGVGAVLTARAVFERGRTGFLGTASGRSLAEFERKERPHIEAIALFSGVLWVTAVPLLLLRQFVARVVLARPGHGGRDAQQVRARIDELERALGVGAYAADDSRRRRG